jgi:dTMP kinase
VHFISFEGGDGCGKTTQLTLLADAFFKSNIDYIRTREPGGSAAGNAIRQLLLNPEKTPEFDKISQLLLLMAARHSHLVEIIRPALQASKWVLCDRFIDSTYAYQIHGESEEKQTLFSTLQHYIVQETLPSLTFLLDMPPEEAEKRRQIRNQQHDVFEAKTIHFHHNVRAGFLQQAAANPQRIVSLDATQSKQQLHEQIIKTLNTRFQLALLPATTRYADIYLWL